MQLSKIQKQIVEAKENFILVNSCAGSGKTRTLSERVKYLLSQGVNPEKIVVITFTNAAAETMLERIGEVPGLQCSTVHSYANRLLLSHGIDTTSILDNENFDKLFSLVKKNPSCIKEVEYLLLDEGQDSTAQQFEFMLDMIQPKNWMIFSDHRQSIFRFADANPEHIITLLHDPKVTVYELYENYRNAPEILQYAQQMIRTLGYDYEDDSISMRKDVQGRVINVDYSESGITRTIQRYVNEGQSEYRDWFVLTRTNTELEAIQQALEKANIPTDTFKKAQLTNKGLKEKMNENTVKVLTIHTAKGLEADNVIVIGARFRDTEEKCVSYVAATRARNLLVWTRKVSLKKQKVAYWGG